MCCFHWGFWYTTGQDGILCSLQQTTSTGLSHSTLCFPKLLFMQTLELHFLIYDFFFTLDSSENILFVHCSLFSCLSWQLVTRADWYLWCCISTVSQLTLHSTRQAKDVTCTRNLGVFSSTHTSNQKAQNRSNVITVCVTRFHSSNTSIC